MPTEALTIEPKNAAKLERLLQQTARQLTALAQTLHRRHQRSPKVRPKAGEPFAFSQRVRVISTRPALRAIRGKVGAVLGRAPARDTWVYTVSIDDQGECWSLSHDELRALSQRTGRHRNVSLGGDITH